MVLRLPPSPPLTEAEIETMYRELVGNHRILPAGKAIISGFVDEVCSYLEPAAAEKIRGVFDRHLAGEKGHMDLAPMVDRLCEQIAPAGFEPVIRKHALKAQAEIHRMAGTVQSALDTIGADARIVFIATKPYFQVLREAAVLRRNGFACALICLDRIPEPMRPAFDEAFDHILDDIRNPGVLARLLEALEVEILHVQCWMWSYYLARIAIERKKNARVVCEIYDFTSVYAPRDVLARNWPREMVDTDLAMERFLCTRADAVTHRYHPVIDDELRERHGGLVRTLYMQPWPARVVDPAPGGKLSGKDGILRMVYAGGIMPDMPDTPPELFTPRSMPRTFRALLDQGFHIDLLHDPHRPVARQKGIDEYRQLAAEYPGFRLLDGVSPDRLPETLSTYDFGLVLTHIDRDVLQVGPGLLRGAIGTKVFSYVEAGIPSIVCKEYAYTAEIVETHELGLALMTDEIETCGDRIRAFDRAACEAAIRRFGAEHSMEREIVKLIDLYREIL